MSSPKNSNSIFIIAGEASGDMHGANLVRELLSTSSKSLTSMKCHVWGGDKMTEAGATVLKHYKELAFMGFAEVAKNIFSIIRNFGLVKKQILELNPKVVVLIDYPGFNLRLLPWLKENGYIVIYYIAPQAWAWKEGRVKKMAQHIDKLLVILPFEEEYFKSRGVKTEFVGHPLLQVINFQNSELTKKQIALLPGSRKQEIENILPEMLSIQSEISDYEFVIAGMSHIGSEFYQKIIGQNKVTIVWDNADEVIQQSELALVSSGTATLQTALYNIPQIVCYKSSWINYQLGKRLIKVKFISLVNLIFGREIVKELIQENLTQSNLSKEVHRLLVSKNREQLKVEYQELKAMLGEKNASKRVAEIILAELNL